MLAFTPPYSKGALGTILVSKRPLKAITPPVYRMLLAARIQTMVDDADPLEAKEILRELGMQEGLRLTLDLTKAGELLAEHSPTLREMAAYPMEPIAPKDFRPDSETESAIAEETLSEWVMRILR